MGKSTVITTTSTDNSVIDALAGVRGDGNITQILDAGAIKDSYSYASRVGDNTSTNINNLLGVFDSVAGKTLQASSDSSKNTLQALQGGYKDAQNAIQDAYTKAANSGLDPQKLVIGIGVIVVIYIFMSKK